MIRRFFVVVLSIATLVVAHSQGLITYRLHPEDVVSIRVVGEQDMNVDAPINFDGTIGIPFLGFIKAAGRTVAELESFIRTELIRQQFFKDPGVSVNIIKFREQRGSVVGGVNRPGEFTFKPGDRLLSLISQAQGPQYNRADLKRATLVRKGSAEQIPLDLHAMLVRGDMSQNYELQDGDIVNIPETRANRVSVVGIVQRPGQFDWFEGMTLADALSAAGGEVPYRSRLSAVQIQRSIPGREYEYSKFTVDFVKFSAKNDFTQNVALEPGDFIYVPPSKNVDTEQASRWANVLYTVQSLLSRNFGFFPRF
jgi:polysaccharide export outer membrane protein